ncbi:MAG TPA: SurA N-terminal domain-containing protein [Terriglobales bacterium]|nr:SurA N-terminal domain-containing protein [Terriglobales bacterium]
MRWNQPNSILLAAVVAIAFLPAHAAEMIDRIVASVNAHIILQSDWDDEVCFEAFSAGRPLEQMAAFDRKAALDHLIDQELLREQVHGSDLPPAPDSDVADRVREIRKAYPQAATDDGWQSLLAHYGLNEQNLESRLRLQLQLMRLVDARLRPSVQIDSKSIESYYNRELLPQLRQAGNQSVALSDVSPKIKELLTQQKVNELLVGWLQNLRSGSNIHFVGATGTAENLLQ